MKTEFEKMRSRELYDFSDPEIDASLRHAKKLYALRSIAIMATASVWLKMSL